MHEFLEHPLEVGVGICASAADLLDKGVDDGTAPAGVFAAYEHPVLVAEFGGADRVFYGVIIEVDMAVFKACGELGLLLGELTGGADTAGTLTLPSLRPPISWLRINPNNIIIFVFKNFYIRTRFC